MQCPKCLRDQFELEKPCPKCGFQIDPGRLVELGHLQWLLGQMTEWGEINIDAAPVSRLKEVYTSRLRDMQVAMGLRLPSFTVEEAANAWVELAHLELLFEKVEEWRAAGYFNEEMGSQDPVRTQRARADELRQRLDEYPRPEFPQKDKDRLKTVSFLLDHIDLLASREWFKSKKEIEKAIAPLMAVMLEVMADNQPE